MDSLFQWASENPEIALILAAVAADLLAGILPDKYTKWPGLILAAARKGYYNGKEDVPPEDKTMDDLVDRLAVRLAQKFKEAKRDNTAGKQTN